MHTIVVGIDPQPDNISTCCLDYKNQKILMWWKYKLIMKETFNKAEEWQDYIVKSVQIICDTIQKLQFTNKQNKHYQSVIVTIEQQRGRVNSIIEQTIFTMCRTLNYETHSFNPMKWKKIIQIECRRNNKLNKDYITKLITPIYEDYEGHKIPAKFRVHDLCDAFAISWATIISKTDNNAVLHKFKSLCMGEMEK
jgi:hypothetical protein